MMAVMVRKVLSPWAWRKYSKTRKIDLCVTIGPAIMMKYTSLVAQKYAIPAWQV